MTQSAILITGGAGYIGSHTVRHLAERGERIVVLDNLSAGHRQAIVTPGVELLVGDIGDAAAVASVFSRWKITEVLHFAAFASVGESVAEPLKYYQNNLAAPLVLLEAMKRHGCRRFIFSSTTATYGNPVRMPMDEQHPQNPINPYGASKLMLERVLRECRTAWGLEHVILRYFNAAGSSEDAVLGEDHAEETHLIPRVLMAVQGRISNITVFGTDYPTPDGTCIRDYIHVLDLAEAHASALSHLRAGRDSLACNLGTGRGCSVNEIIRLCGEVTGREVPVAYGPRRPGDPPELVADPSLARQVLGWQARYREPVSMVESAWRWFSAGHGGRYGVTS